MSVVGCHLPNVNFFFLFKGVKLVGEGSDINGATPSSLYCRGNIHVSSLLDGEAKSLAGSLVKM